MKLTTKQQAALDLLDDGSLTDGGEVRYYDSATGRYYIGSADDLDRLYDLLGSRDLDTARDAYSLWCATTAHREEEDCPPPRPLAPRRKVAGFGGAGMLKTC